MANRLRAAIVGCGRISTYTRPELRAELHAGFLPYNHAESMLVNPDIELIALCDTSAENLARACKQYGVEHQFSSYQNLITEIRPDIISLGTRTPVKAEIIRFAALHGVKGIHIEKPIANSMRSTRGTLRIMQENEVRFTYGTVRRFMDIFVLAKKMMDEGKIGRILNIEVRSGRTLLFWRHPHSTDMLLFLNNGHRVKFVQATCALEIHDGSSSLIEEDPTLDNAFMEFENGVSATISSSPGNDVLITGSEGTLLIAADARWIELTKTSQSGSSVSKKTDRIDVSPLTSGTARAFQSLATSIRLKGETGIRASDIEYGQEILFLSALSSIHGGMRFAPEQLPEDFTILAKTAGLSA